MKHTKILAFVFMMLLFSCSQMEKKNSTDKILSFLPGTYVRAFEGEYSVGHDTLVISQPDSKTNYYTIKHNSSYQKIRDKQLQPIEYKTENWTAIFNEKDNVLVEQKYGKLISVLPDQDELLLGESKFKKIK
jgi:hypothetical protein